MTKYLPGFSPGQLSSELGLAHSTWHKMGDGPWMGTVIHEGLEWEIEELKTSWRATSVAAQVVEAPQLQALLKKLMT